MDTIRFDRKMSNGFSSLTTNGVSPPKQQELGRRKSFVGTVGSCSKVAHVAHDSQVGWHLKLYSARSMMPRRIFGVWESQYWASPLLTPPDMDSSQNWLMALRLAPKTKQARSSGKLSSRLLLHLIAQRASAKQ